MLSRLFRRGAGSAADPAQQAYRSVMAAALDPALYKAGLAEDTFDGRFEATALFGALAMRRLREAGPPGRALADRLYRRLFDGFDYALRETGVGDATIAKKIRALGERFFGLARALDSAIETDAPDAAVLDVLERNAVGGPARPALAARLVAASERLAAQGDASVLTGDFSWRAASDK